MVRKSPLFRARCLVGPGVPRSPPLEPRDGNVPGARLLEFIFVRSPRRRSWYGGGINGSHAREVAGLDVHKAKIVACVRIMSEGKVKRECRTFETSTTGLEALLDWLTASGCRHVAMEATGVYWKPVWNILSDGAFELIVANAAHIKTVPGRKTDVNDATWIADLLACGLIRASFVPDQTIQELRSLLRARKQLTREQTSHIQRIQKTLEEANIKLDSVISDIMGVSGRRMIEAMIAGVRNPHKLAALADRRIKAAPKVLYDALHGRLTDYHRFMLELYLGQHDALSQAIAKIDDAVDAATARMDEAVEAGQASFRSLILLLCSVPEASTSWGQRSFWPKSAAT